jgi:energy-coupling factor transporter ATPase
MLRFDDIEFSYRSGSAPVRAIAGVSLTVSPGQHVAVLGANGSGKSTLAKLANGILLPDRGTVSVDGIETRDEARIRTLRGLVGIVFQHPDDQIVATSVEDDVAFGPENLGLPRDIIRARVDEALAAVGLTGLADREPHLLSGGQKQRLAIAGALAMSPAYVVLDEPASMLDPEGRADVLRIVTSLRGAGHGILHITHDLAEVTAADHALVLDSGRPVFEGTPSELFGLPELLTECGLELPAAVRLSDRLRELGAPIPLGARTPETMAESLWA